MDETPALWSNNAWWQVQYSEEVGLLVTLPEMWNILELLMLRMHPLFHNASMLSMFAKYAIKHFTSYKSV